MNASIYCPHCHKHTALSMPLAIKITGEFRAAWRDYPNQSIWWIGVCNACQKPSLVQDNAAKVYPDPLPEPTDQRIPSHIASDLDEAKRCYSVTAYRAAAVMARRCVQSACVAMGATKGDLVVQVKELETTGVITKDLAAWATVVRWIGNDGAHPNPSTVQASEAKDCLDLANQFLHVVFVTPAVAKARMAARSKP